MTEPFQTAVVYDSGGPSAISLAVSDLNRDGKPDIALAKARSDVVGVLLGNGDGTFHPAVVFGSGGQQSDFVK